MAESRAAVSSELFANSCSMPWTPRVTEREVAAAVGAAETWRDVLDALGYAYHGKNIATIRKWADRWGISTAHLRGPRRVSAVRKVERPPHATLLREVRAHGYVAVGRKYGVSDDAVRKWLRAHEREAIVAAGREPDTIEVPARTWPKHHREREAA